jgi:aryl-alcohol dehydrogenase-like predicted oxidoreductase
MFGLLTDQGVGCLLWSPLVKGRLARPWGERTRRFDTDPVGRRFFGDGDQAVIGPCSASRRHAACRWPRSPWPGC